MNETKIKRTSTISKRMLKSRKEISKIFLENEYLTQKKSIHKIAEELGCCSMTVFYRLVDFSIPRRHTGVNHVSEERKQFSRDWNKTHPEINKMKGKHHSIETRRIMSQNRQREQNGHWKGGLTPEYNLHHNNPEWAKRRIECYQRDHYTCRTCGKKGNGSRSLQAHHIIPWRISRDDNLDNLVTACLKCHRKIEGQPLEVVCHL